MPYPEHEKLKEISDDSQKFGEFLEWLQENGYVLAQWRKYPGHPPDDELVPCREPTEKILAKRFDIDLDVLEREKRQMLDELRAANNG